MKLFGIAGIFIVILACFAATAKGDPSPDPTPQGPQDLLASVLGIIPTAVLASILNIIPTSS